MTTLTTSACECVRHPHAKGGIIARPQDITRIHPECRHHGDTK